MQISDMYSEDSFTSSTENYYGELEEPPTIGQRVQRLKNVYMMERMSLQLTV